MGLVWWLIVGAIAGGAARAIWPGPDPLTLGQTLALGLAGSFVGGFIFNLIGPGSIFSVRRAGLIGSIVGAVVALGVWRIVANSSKGSVPPSA
ncbi:MAG: GlsB/YeaQ/YmgE family stress response membrane protein [Acidimicrobiia bacterium]|nr:GlsB/YeaQ/YmgE family stress response membrane protein [Acidimicrobiia bacterium]MDH3471994.1 GlsB/YeaQ/YmgE family stress response membrane protein [Acidimicrobiia bacterium]